MANAILDTKTTYGDMIKKEAIAPILGLNPDDPFDIVSENEQGLMMIHYRPDADLNFFGNLRGVVIDTQKNSIVSYAYPHTETFVTSSIPMVDGKICLGEVSLDPEKVRFKMGFEGTLFHVFKHGGQVYRTTRKRLEPARSRWGNSKTFGEIYWELGGPKDEELFDPEKKYSPYCHSFIMVHPDLLVATRDDVGKGYLVYLGPKKIYPTNEKCPYPLEEVDTNLSVPKNSSSIEEVHQKGIPYSPGDLSLEDANKHLLFGFYEEFEGYEFLDARTLPGEFLILENKENGQMFRLESPAYSWRASIRNNNPNLFHRFFELLDYSYLKNEDEELAKYLEMFPILTKYEKEDLKKILENSPIVVWPQDTAKAEFLPSTKEEKMYNIWMNYLVSSPLGKQKEVLEYLDRMNEKREEVIDWFISLSEDSNTNLEKFSTRAQDILVKTKSFALTRFNRKQNFDFKTQKWKTIDELTQDNIRNFLGKEKGTSLYRLIREMDLYKNPREEN